MNAPISILLIDDHPVVRTGYRRLLESKQDMHVIAEAESGETGYLLYQEHRPDVTILDLNMPGICGFETIRRIIGYNASARILVFSMFNNITMAQRALKAGAMGFISKQSAIDEMIRAVHQISSGKIYIESELMTTLALYATHDDLRKNPLDTLTKREFQIFKLIAEGNSNVQIAEKISISPKTVSVHCINLMRKLQLQNTLQLISLAIDHNIVQKKFV